MRLKKLSLALPLLFLLVACDTEPSGPDGPSGGENRFRVVIGGDKEPFDEVALEIRATTGGTSMMLVGSVDPIKNAVDDEYALHLEILLDENGLIATTAPATLAVKGSASFSPGPQAGGLETVEYQMDPSSSAVVKGVFLRRSCFCGNQDSGEQSFEGTITVDQVSADEITGTLTLQLTGDVPNYSDALDATLSAEFNLAIP